jgi:hypothetical protein
MSRPLIIILYENVFQNPELFGTEVSLSPEQSTLVLFLFNTQFIYSNRDVYTVYTFEFRTLCPNKKTFFCDRTILKN